MKRVEDSLWSIIAWLTIIIAYYPPTKSEGYSFGVVRPSVHSVRPHFLSVRNHISVPIGQIWFILGINDKYHELSISYKFGQLELLPLFKYSQLLGNSSKLLYLTTSHY